MPCELTVGEGVERGHVWSNHEKQDIERAGDIQAKLHIGAVDQSAAKPVALLRRVALQLDLDDRRQGVAGGPLRQDRDLCGDDSRFAQPPQSAGDGRRRKADALRELIGGAQIVLLKGGEKLSVQLVEFARENRFLPIPCGKIWRRSGKFCALRAVLS